MRYGRSGGKRKPCHAYKKGRCTAAPEIREEERWATRRKYTRYRPKCSPQQGRLRLKSCDLTDPPSVQEAEAKRYVTKLGF